MPTIWYEVRGLKLVCYYDVLEGLTLKRCYMNDIDFDSLDSLKKYIQDKKIEVLKWK